MLGHLRALVDAGDGLVPLVSPGRIGRGVPLYWPGSAAEGRPSKAKTAYTLSVVDGDLVAGDAMGEFFLLAGASTRSLFLLLGSLVVSVELELERKNKNRQGQ